MQVRIGGQDLGAGLGAALAVDGGDDAARLGDEQDAGGHVPGLEVALIEGVVAPRGDPGEVQSGRTQATDAGDALADGVEVLDGLGVAGLADEGQAGGDQAFDRSRRAATRMRWSFR